VNFAKLLVIAVKYRPSSYIVTSSTKISRVQAVAVFFHTTVLEEKREEEKRDCWSTDNCLKSNPLHPTVCWIIILVGKYEKLSRF